MHIAIDVRSLMEGRHSGIEEYTTRIIQAMAEYESVHTYHVFYNSARKVSLPAFRENVVVHEFRYPNKLLNASQWLFSIPKWDALLKQHIDVVFMPNARLMPLSYTTPLVTVAHDVSFERFPEFLTMKRRLWHALMRPRHLLENSDHIIAVSEYTKQDLIEVYGIHPNTISVVHPGVADPDVVRPLDVQAVCRQYQLPDRFLLFMGTLEPRKNIAGVISAFSAIAHRVPHDLVLAGERGWKEKGIARAIASSAYADRIHEIGFVEERFKRPLYAAADVFVYPSFYEGFGFPPLEAMLAGTPAAVSFNSSLPEVVGKWATLVDPYDTAQIAAVLEELLSPPARVPLDAQRQIREEYSWKKAAHQTVDI